MCNVLRIDNGYYGVESDTKAIDMDDVRRMNERVKRISEMPDVRVLSVRRRRRSKTISKKTKTPK
jgi:hypothetical protein